MRGQAAARGQDEITAIVVGDLPPDFNVGDAVRLTGADVRVVAIEEDLVDTTVLGGPTSYAPGTRAIRLLITDIEWDAS